MEKREFEIRAIGFFVYEGDSTEEEQLVLLENAEAHAQHVEGVQYQEDYAYHSAKNILFNVAILSAMLELAYMEGTRKGMMDGQENINTVFREIQAPNIKKYPSINREIQDVDEN
jgi:hypothetical protein